MQIAHHSNYIRWFEEARTFFLEKEGFGYDRMEKEGIACPVTEVGCRYIGMVRFPDDVAVEVRVRSFSGVRMRIEYIVRDAKSEKICAEGFSKHCFLSPSGRPVALQKEKPDLFGLLKRSVEEDT